MPRAAKIRCASHTPIFVFAVAVRTQSTIYPAVRTHLAPHSPQSPTRRPASRPKAAYVHVLPPPLAPRVLVGVGCSRGRDDHSGHGRAPFRRRGALSDPEPQLSRALREATGWCGWWYPVRVSSRGVRRRPTVRVHGRRGRRRLVQCYKGDLRLSEGHFCRAYKTLGERAHTESTQRRGARAYRVRIILWAGGSRVEVGRDQARRGEISLEGRTRPGQPR